MVRKSYGKMRGTRRKMRKKEKLSINRYLAEFRTGGKYDDVFPQRWMPAAIGVLPEPFSQENHQLSSMNKLVRDKVTAAYAERMEFMYTPEAKNITNEKNLASLGEI